MMVYVLVFDIIYVYICVIWLQKQVCVYVKTSVKLKYSKIVTGTYNPAVPGADNAFLERPKSANHDQNYDKSHDQTDMRMYPKKLKPPVQYGTLGGRMGSRVW